MIKPFHLVSFLWLHTSNSNDNKTSFTSPASYTVGFRIPQISTRTPRFTRSFSTLLPLYKIYIWWRIELINFDEQSSLLLDCSIKAVLALLSTGPTANLSIDKNRVAWSWQLHSVVFFRILFEYGSKLSWYI